jgi:hypothetical protein
MMGRVLFECMRPSLRGDVQKGIIFREGEHSSDTCLVTVGYARLPVAIWPVRWPALEMIQVLF